MKFKFIYIPINPTPAFPDLKKIPVPVIPITIHNQQDPSNYIHAKALVDSGAGFSIFPANFGEAIGLTIENEREMLIQGIERSQFRTYVHDIVLGVGGWQFETIACFAKKDIFMPVLGRDGFFNLFKVILDYPKREIELKNLQKPIKIESH